MAKCRIDSFRLRGTGSMCHMFLLNVEFGNSFGFSSVTFRRLAFSIPAFSVAPLLTQMNRALEVARIFFTKHSKYSCWQCLCTECIKNFIESVTACSNRSELIGRKKFYPYDGAMHQFPPPPWLRRCRLTSLWLSITSLNWKGRYKVCFKSK